MAKQLKKPGKVAKQSPAAQTEEEVLDTTGADQETEDNTKVSTDEDAPTTDADADEEGDADADAEMEESPVTTETFPGAPKGTIIGPGDPVRFKGVLQGVNQVRVAETVYQAVKPPTSKRYVFSQVLVEGTVIPLDRVREVGAYAKQDFYEKR